MLESEILKTLGPQFVSNINRLSRLRQIDELLPKDHSEYKEYLDEILRAMVVLLHASFEDALREFVRLKFTTCPPEALHRIPLAGLSPTGQPKKFSLFELRKHQGLTVDELIQESIDEFLNRTSFNSTDDIAGILQLLQVDISHIQKYFADLDEMISRRHQIVHQADLIGPPTDRSLAPIDKSSVVEWIATVTIFIFRLHLTEASPEVQDSIASSVDEWEKDLLSAPQ